MIFTRTAAAPRSAAYATVALALAAGITACGGSPAGDDSGEPPAAAPASGAYPLTIEHHFGSTTIESEPTRIVAVGFSEADFLLAFDVVPVGVRDYIGEFPEETRAWAQDALAGAQPENIGEEINFERVAGLQPDLILGLYSLIGQADYEKLAAIAPTIGPLTADGNITWQDQTLTTGRALGQDERAQEIVAETEQAFTDAAAANPEFAGKSLAVLFAQGGQFYVLEPTDPRAQFFTGLGFADPGISGELSAEQLPLVDKDVLVVLGSEEADLADDPLFQSLAVVRENRTVYFGTFATEFAGALGFGSPLSLPYAVDVAVPRLQAAADGDRSTSTD